MRRRVSDQKDDLKDFAVAAPGHLVNCFGKCLVHTLRCIATATGLELAQMSVNGIDVVGETERLHDVFIAAIPITNEPEL